MSKTLSDPRLEIIFADHLKTVAEIITDLHHDNAAGICAVDAEARLKQLYKDSLGKLTDILTVLDAEFGHADGCHD